MFCNDLREKYEEKIILKGVDAETMNILLDYTYTSKMLITKQNVQKVLEAASLFQVQKTQMHWSNLTALATPCLTLASTLQTSLISRLLEAFGIIFSYMKVKKWQWQQCTGILLCWVPCKQEKSCCHVLPAWQGSPKFRSACEDQSEGLVGSSWHGWPEQGATLPLHLPCLEMEACQPQLASSFVALVM